MKKVLSIITVLFLLCTCVLTEGEALSVDSENGAARFTAYPGIYIAGEDFPVGTYEIKCADGTSLINVVIEDTDGKDVLRGGFWSRENEMIGKIKLLEGYIVNISDGSAYFAPSAGGIVFDSDTSSREESPAAETLLGHDSAVKNAIEALKSFWFDSYQEDGSSENGYLEIKNTRVIDIKDEFPESDEKQSGVSNTAEQIFGNIDYIVEFMLFSDYFGSAPYYSNIYINNCVIIFNDGTYSVGRDQLDLYRSRTYSADYSGIIEQVFDYGSVYNAVYELLK